MSLWCREFQTSAPAAGAGALGCGPQLRSVLGGGAGASEQRQCPREGNETQREIASARPYPHGQPCLGVGLRRRLRPGTERGGAGSQATTAKAAARPVCGSRAVPRPALRRDRGHTLGTPGSVGGSFRRGAVRRAEHPGQRAEPWSAEPRGLGAGGGGRARGGPGPGRERR